MSQRHKNAPAEPPKESSSEEAGAQSTTNSSRPGSVGDEKAEIKQRPVRVKFSVGGEDDDESEHLHQDPASSILPLIQLRKPIPQQRALPLVDIDASADVTEVSLEEPEWTGRRKLAADTAQQRASRLENRLSRSAPGSRRTSLENVAAPRQDELLSPTSSPPQHPVTSVGMEGIPLMDISKLSKLERESTRRPYSVYEDNTDTDTESDARPVPAVPKAEERSPNRPTAEAKRLVKSFTRGLGLHTARSEQHASGTETPAVDRRMHDYDYVEKPPKFRAGVLSSLLKLQDHQSGGAAQRRAPEPRKDQRPPHPQTEDANTHRSQSNTPASNSEQSSGRVTPKKTKWYHSPNSQSTSSLANLLPSSVSGRPGLPRSRSSGVIDKLAHPGALFNHKKPRLEDEIRITVHIAEVIARQKYLIELCRGLMRYGAPTHRLEEYMRSSARVLEIDAHFLYFPGCMVVSFDDPDTHTTEVKLVKENQGVDLGKFKDVFLVYKAVV